jgi:hypothetical protein
MTKDEALDLALETLESIQAVYPCETVGKRITAIKQALAAPVQEPVAWIHVDAYQPSNRHLEWKENCKGYEGDWVKHPLYTTPPAAQRQWVGLTDKEINQLWRDVVKWGDPSHDDVDLMKAIEDKLKERNT